MAENRLTTARSIWIKGAVLGLLLCVGEALFYNPWGAASALLGVVIALANFWLLSALVKGLIAKTVTKPWKLVGIFILKTIVLFGSIGLVLLKVPVHLWSFLAGLSTIVIVVMLEGIRGAFSN